jgi:hypothetical protein
MMHSSPMTHVRRIVLVGAQQSAAASVSISDRDAGGTRRSFPIPPGPAQEATLLIFRGVVSTVAPLALSRSCEGRSRSQRSRHSTENRRKSRGDPMESRVESALACPPRKIWEKRTVPAPIVEPTCAAFSTTKKQPCASNGGKKLRETQLSVVRGDDDDY